MAKRTKIFFMRGFQLRYTFLVAGSLGVLLLFAGFHGFFVAASALPVEAWEGFRPELIDSTWRLFAVGLLYVSVVTMAAVFLSHKSVGPMGRLQEELNAIAESGGKKKLTVREGDELEELVASINKVMGPSGKRKKK